VRSFAYPFGKPEDYSAETVGLVREAGFEVGVVNTAGVVQAGMDPLAWPRLHVQDWDADLFERELSRAAAGTPG
jgi:hypothetical protein